MEYNHGSRSPTLDKTLVPAGGKVGERVEYNHMEKSERLLNLAELLHKMVWELSRRGYFEGISERDIKAWFKRQTVAELILCSIRNDWSEVDVDGW